MSLTLGQQLIAPIEAAAATIQERTGVECTVGPVDSLSRGAQLIIRPEQPTLEKSRESRRPVTETKRVAYDTVLRLRAKGGLNKGFRSEAAEAHLLTNAVLDKTIQVDITDAVPNTQVPDDAPEGSIPAPRATVDAEGEGVGQFFQPSPSENDYLYQKDWLLTVRFEVSSERLTQLINA